MLKVIIVVISTIGIFLLLIWIVSIFFCKFTSSRQKPGVFVKNAPKFLLIAHKGASREFPENTMAAFKRAVEIYPDAMLETDVRATKDNKIIIAHDSLLEVTTNAKGMIKDYTLAELKKLDAGYNISFDNGKTHPFRGQGYELAALDELLEQFPNSRMSIDIKYHNINFARDVIALIKKHNAVDRVILASFDSRINDLIKRDYPEFSTNFVESEIKRFLILHKLHIPGFFSSDNDVLMIPEFSDQNQPEYLGENASQGFRLVTPQFIKDAHKRNMPVYVWTINNEDNMRRLIEWGVDGIITDRPALLYKILIEKHVYFLHIKKNLPSA